MAEDDKKHKTHKMDGKLVAAKEPYEVTYLTRKFKYLGVKKADVLSAIAAVGHSREEAEAYIKAKFTPTDRE